jgi:polysaccharide export outer membrane protein
MAFIGLLPLFLPMKIMRLLFLCALAAFLSSGSLCADEGNPVRMDYLLQPSDLLRVQIFQEDDLMREVRVSQEYTVTLPLIGTIDLRGKSLLQAQETIRNLYDRDYLVNPQVNVMVLAYAKRTVNVLGAVNSSGAVEFPEEEGLTLLDAITRAGGFNRLADRRRVKLTRTNAEGATENYIINADDIMQGTSQESWPLQRDEVIFVPERIL